MSKLRTIIIADIERRSLSNDLLKHLLKYIQWEDADFTADESIISLVLAKEQLNDTKLYDELIELGKKVDKVKADYIRLVDH